MNCLEVRRSLLAAPRERSAALRAHVAGCRDCRNLEVSLAELDEEIGEAASVPIPDALASRVLLGRRHRMPWQFAAAAVIALASAAFGALVVDVLQAPDRGRTTEAVGPTHPAIAAIAQVIDEELGAAQAAVDDGPAEIEQGLRRLGLALRKGKATAHYVGKCYVSGSADCDHIVLSTADAHANVLLVLDYPLPDRMLVSDRRMIALVNPALHGGYIVVADSARTARRMQKLFVRG